MTDKAMPPVRIYAHFNDDVGRWITVTHPVDEGVEYIRAGLVPAQGSANEPLEAGQWRWVRVNDADGWEAALVSKFGQKIRIANSSIDLPIQRLAKIGPAIKPPADSLSN